MKNLTHVAARFVNTPLMLHPPKLEVIIKALGPRLGIDAQLVPRSEVPAVLAESYESAGDDAEYQVVDGVALIGVQGTLLKKDTWMSTWSGCTSYQSIQRQVTDAVNDARVRAILLDIDSPGGETTGCFELADYIYSVRGLKPIYAVANDGAFSAAYAIASAADKVYVTRMGAVGSVGVYALHTSQAGFDKEIGVAYKYIHHGAKKVDGNPHEDLSDSAEADIQAEVDREGVIFESTVARNRKADVKAIIALEAGILWADAAIPLLADKVGTLEDAMADLQVALTGGTSVFQAASSRNQGERMTDEKIVAATEMASTDETLKTCKACGKQAAKGDKFCSKCGTSLEPEPEPAKQDDEKEEGKKATAQSTLIPGLAAAPEKASRTVKDIQAISALCSLAGCGEKAAEFLASNQTVAEVSEELTAARVKESEKHMIQSGVNTNKGAAGMQDLEAEAVVFARQNHITKEQAVAKALENNPEVYAAYRARHNAAPLVAQLEAAGIKFRE